MNAGTIECGHVSCACHVLAFDYADGYCCDYCRSSERDDADEEMCGCGHPQCDLP